MSIIAIFEVTLEYERLNEKGTNQRGNMNFAHRIKEELENLILDNVEDFLSFLVAILSSKFNTYS